jgi:hypothetical protein
MPLLYECSSADDLSGVRWNLAVAESESEVFLLRIWAEPREIRGQPSVYRGRIEHVRSSRSRYIRSLSQVVEFVDECLANSDLPFGGFQDERDG